MQQSTIKARAHAACAVNDEVWVARQEGGIAVFDAVSEALVAEIDLHVDGNDHVVARALMVVFHEVWVATVEGHVLIISIKARQLSTNSPLRLCVEDQAPHHGPVAEMCFNGHVAAIATSAGRTWLVHPIRKSVMAELITSASCTSVAHFYSFVVVGDVDGGLTIFDVLTGEIVVAHTRSSSEVLRVLHERSTGTLWVARKNGNVDVYELQQRELVLVRRVEGVGRTTSMMELSGNVVVSTYERKILIIRATTATIEEQIHAAHGSFVSGLTKVRHQEVARVWSLGNDEVMHGWTLSGHGVAINPPPFVSPVEQAAITSAMHGSWAMERANFGVRVEEERKKSVDLQDNLRKLREESQELRLRLLKMEEMIQVKDAELATQTGRVRLLEEETRKLSADITNMTTTVMNSERERLLLQADANQARDDLTRCRTEVQQVQSAKAMVDQELSQRSTEKFHVEQRLMDCQNKLASITAENARLCAAVGNVASAQRAERDVQAKIIEGSAATNQELEQVRSMNRMLSSLLASMQYSLRRKEQEDRDLTALLSAFRRKVADHVTDPFLSALLLATMVRNPMRLELECDDVTRGQLMDRHGPFMQFLEALREQDREAYDKLIDYLQLSSSDNLSPETRQLVDSFVRLAVKDGKVSTESIASFKRSIPNLMEGSGAGATATIIPPPSGYPSPGVGLLPNNAMMAAASPTTTSLPYNVGLPPMSTAVGALNMVGLPPPLPPNPSATSPAAMPNGYELPLPPLPTSMVGLIGAATPGSTAASPNTNTTTINNNASYLPALLSPPPIHGLASPTAAPAATTPQSPLPLPLGVPTISPYPPPVAEEDGQTDSLMKVIRNQYAMDERYLREHRAMFEFIIKTRRSLAECLALLFKRTVSAKQVVEALTGGTSATAAGTPAHLSNIFRGIIEELAELVADVVTKYLTASEKQRLGVQ